MSLYFCQLSARHYWRSAIRGTSNTCCQSNISSPPPAAADCHRVIVDAPTDGRAVEYHWRAVERARPKIWFVVAYWMTLTLEPLASANFGSHDQCSLFAFPAGRADPIPPRSVRCVFAAAKTRIPLVARIALFLAIREPNVTRLSAVCRRIPVFEQE